MNLDQINQMGEGLYQDPALAVPMRDALEDLGMTWVDWLEQAGKLRRLAEVMSIVLGSESSAPRPRINEKKLMRYLSSRSLFYDYTWNLSDPAPTPFRRACHLLECNPCDGRASNRTCPPTSSINLVGSGLSEQRLASTVPGACRVDPKACHVLESR